VVSQERSNRRTDEQLQAIIRETGHWAVTGQQGSVLCFAASLARAIDRAAEFAASDAVVIAIRRLPSDDIIVFPGQIERLRMMLDGTGPIAAPAARNDSVPSESSLHY
jgi:hypothetical protein